MSRRATPSSETRAAPRGAADAPSAEALDPFADARSTTGLLDGRIADDQFVMVLRYRDLKAAARDWRTFSNDAPFRVPIPGEHAVRSVRQLPIETDPPAHTAYRAIVKEPFSRATADAIQPAVERIAADLLRVGLEAGSLEVVHDFALPLQSRSLALMLGRHQDEATEWISWGTHVFGAHREGGQGESSHLDRYLERAVDQAIAAPGDDFFGLLATSTFEGRALTREEMLGFANLTFAGGRDTVINAVVNSLHHLAAHPSSMQRLQAEPELLPTAVEELLRYFSPLTHIGRVNAADSTVAGHALPSGALVSLCYASANRDPDVFEDPGECRLDRSPNRHVAFGHGPHTCLGAPLARMVLTTALQLFLARVGRCRVREALPKIENLGSVTRQVGFERLVVGLSPRQP